MGKACSKEPKTVDRQNVASKVKASWAHVPLASKGSLKERSSNPDDYLASNLSNTLWAKLPGEVSDQRINIDNCTGVTFVLLDQLDSVQIDDCDDCKFFIGPAMGSVFVRNCSNCIFMGICGQLRTRDVKDSTFLIYCQSRPVIESSTNIRFGCFPASHGYFQLLYQMCRARLSVFNNLYRNVHDFTPSNRSNFAIIPNDEQDAASSVFPPLATLISEHITTDEDRVYYECDAPLPFILGLDSVCGNSDADVQFVLFKAGEVEIARGLLCDCELKRRNHSNETLCGVMASLEHTFGNIIPPAVVDTITRLSTKGTKETTCLIDKMINNTFIMVLVVNCRDIIELLDTKAVLLLEKVTDATLLAPLFIELPVTGKGFGNSHKE